MLYSLTTSIAKFETRSDAGCITHQMSDVVLFIDALEHVSLGSDGENAYIISSMSL